MKKNKDIIPPPINPKAVERAGVEQYSDVLRIIPNSYLDFTEVKIGYSTLVEGELTILAGRMASRVTTKYSTNKSRIATFDMTDGSETLAVMCFGDNAKYAEKVLPDPGDIVHARGKVQIRSNSGVLYLFDAQVIPETKVGRLEPIYPSDATKAIGQYIPILLANDAAIRSAVASLLKYFPGEDSKSVLKRCGVTNGLSLEDFLSILHNPANNEEARTAQKVAARLNALELCFQAMRLKYKAEVPGSALAIKQEQINALIGRLPFKLTGDQSSAIADIFKTLVSNHPTFHLISGDVGTGKTAVFMVLAAAAYLAGAKVVVLVPNLLVVEQHLKVISGWWPSIPALRVIGTTKLKQADLDARPILVGTTALITRLKKHNYIPDLMIVDEQHKLSKEQRESVMGNHTHYIEATATCIPRTMAVVTHGGMTLSTLHDSPYVKVIKTFIVEHNRRHKLFEQIEKCLKADGQVAVIYPRIEAKAELDKDKFSFEEALKLWETRFGKEVRGLNGTMKDFEKTAILDAMRAKEFHILVTTTVIEVGVDLPDLKAVIVVEADKFGASQLHQMRGRVARHGGNGYCFLYLPQPVEENTMQRLRALETITDGFSLAEHDMKSRGSGDLFDGTRQAGKAVLHAFLGAKLDYPALQAVLRINNEKKEGSE